MEENRHQNITDSSIGIFDIYVSNMDQYSAAQALTLRNGKKAKEI